MQFKTFIRIYRQVLATMVAFAMFIPLITLAQTISYVRTWDAVSPQAGPNAMMAKPEQDVHQATQYIDGLGRPLQTVAQKASPNGYDMVVPIVYDAFGRESLKYLPYFSGSDGNYKTAPITDQTAFYNDAVNSPIKGQNETFFYGQTDFESSPLNRPIKDYAPGNSWAGAGKGVEKKYWLNTDLDVVNIWNVDESGTDGVFATYTSLGNYGASQLYKNVTIDENGKQVIQFTDKDGHVVLKKVQLDPTVTDDGSGKNNTGWLCTCYIYDDLGNLRCLIQPKGMELGCVLTDATILAEQCFRYEYDQRNRMTMKKVPGAGEVYMVYDARDRLVMVQDANMRLKATDNWMVTAYDDLDRPVQTGLWTSNGGFSSHLAAAYISTNYPGSVGNLLTKTHYDDYTSLPAGLSSTLVILPDWKTQFASTSNSSFPYPQMPVQNSTTTNKGMVTWAQVAVLGTNNLLASASIYDDRGRTIQVQSLNITDGLDVATTQYSWAGQPLTVVQKQEKATFPYAQTTVTVTQIDYDAMGRATTTRQKLGNTLVNNNTMAAYKTVSIRQYNELGQLKSKGLGNNLETLAYDYNIRGWLLGINRAFVQDVSTANPVPGSGEIFTTPPSFSAGNYFGFDLGYDRNGVVGSYTPQYNGNIGGMVWKSANDGQVRKYDFTYDAVNRLTSADFNQYTGNGFNKTGSVDFSVGGLDYDANGNISHMNQKGLVNNAVQWVDQLAYTYQPNSNKLVKVADTAPNNAVAKLGDFQDGANSGDDYGYDPNGNMTSDLNKGISKIIYNVLNLPLQIDVTGKGTINYTYDAAGNKLQKTTTEGSSTTNTTYMGGMVYQNDVLQFIGMGEGRIRPNASLTGFNFDYYLKDHLGNTRMTLTDDPTVPSPILDATSYYPFGLTMAGISSKASGSLENKIKFNGKELENSEFSDGLGLDWYEYGMREFDAQIGRFFRIDPLSEKFFQLTPYQYASNDPIANIDLDGLEGTGAVSGSASKDQKQNNPPELNKQTWGTMAIKTAVGPDGGAIDGHAWLEFKRVDGQVTTLSLWGNQGDQEFFANKEIGLDAVTSRTVTITNGDIDKINTYDSNPDNVDWTCTNTCAGYSTRVWDNVTGEKLDASNWMGFSTPTKLAGAIINQNGGAVSNTPNAAPGNNNSGSNGNSSSSSGSASGSSVSNSSFTNSGSSRSSNSSSASSASNSSVSAASSGGAAKQTQQQLKASNNGTTLRKIYNPTNSNSQQ